MALQIKPLDPEAATLDVEAEIAKFFGKGHARTHKIEKLSGHPGKQSHRVAFAIHLRRDGAKDLQKFPIVLRVSSRDARRLGRMLTQMADEAEGIV